MVEEISDIDGVGPKTLEKLEEGGISTLNDVVECDIEELTSVGMSTGKAKDIKQQAERSTVVFQTGTEVQKEYDGRKNISSGLESLDEFTEGGFSQGEIVAIYGSDGAGKTQLCFKSIVNAVEESGEKAVWIETERSRFRPERIKSFSNDEDILDKIYRIKAYDLDQQLQAYRKIKDDLDEVCMIVLDSLTARFRLTDKFDERSNLSARSSELGRHLLEIEQMVESVKCPCLMTAQVYQAPTQYSSGDDLWGGSLLKHTIMYRVYMSESSGEVYEVTVEQHPSTGDNSFHINITDNDIMEV